MVDVMNMNGKEAKGESGVWNLESQPMVLPPHSQIIEYRVRNEEERKFGPNLETKI